MLSESTQSTETMFLNFSPATYTDSEAEAKCPIILTTNS